MRGPKGLARGIRGKERPIKGWWTSGGKRKKNFWRGDLVWGSGVWGLGGG